MNTHQHQAEPANPEIVHTNGATVMTGDGVELFRLVNIRFAISFWVKTKMKLTRGATITHLLALAGEVTKKTYKRTEAQQAIDDLDRHIATLKASLAIVDQRTGSQS